MAVVAGGDTAPIFEPAEQSLDDVPAAVDASIEWIRGATRGGGWDHGFDAAVGEPAAQTISVIGLVGNETANRRGDAQQWNSHADIGNVAGRQGKGDRSAAIVGQAVDLAGPTTARAADRFLQLPLFEPAAERWAFTCVLSIDNSSGTGPAPAIFSNNRCQIPRDAHRL